MKKYTIHVGRYSNSTGNFGNSKPCVHCLSMLKKYGIRKIAYTTDDGVIKVRTSSLFTSHKSMAYRQMSKFCSI